MSESSWLIPVSVIAGGLLGGYAMLALTQRKQKPTPPARKSARATHKSAHHAETIDALNVRKTELFTRLRSLDPSETAERTALEVEAATVMRELDRLAPGAAATSVRAATDAPDEGAGPATGGLSPQLVGALKGGALVAAAFLVYLALQSSTVPRSEGMGMTGGPGPTAPAMGGGMAPSASAPPSDPSGASDDSAGMGTAPGQRPAPSLAPIPSARLDEARALVAAHPDSHDAKIALGWALVDSKGWIELYRLVESLVEANADDLDALALAAPVQLAMGQRQPAAELLERVLAGNPEHPQALVWRGRIAQLAGDTEAQADYWRRAHAAAGKVDVDALIASFEAAPAPKPHAAGNPNPAPSPSPVSIVGTLSLASGVTAPPGATLFIIARTAGVTTGPPLATRKIPNPTFPRAFTVGPEDVMMQGVIFGGEVSLEARLDSDGDARTRSPGDLFATWPDPVPVGAHGIELELSAP